MSTYLAEDARLIRSLLPPSAAPPPESDALFVGYAVLMRAKGADVTSADVHNAWSAWMLTHDPGHPSLVPFEDLPSDVQAMDAPYAAAIRAAAAHRADARDPVL